MMMVIITKQVKQPVKGFFDIDLLDIHTHSLKAAQCPAASVGVTRCDLSEGQRGGCTRLAEPREISSGRIWIMTLQSGSAPTLYQEKKKDDVPTRPPLVLRVNGRMDFFFFFLFCRPIYLILIGITLLPWCSGGGRRRGG